MFDILRASLQSYFAQSNRRVLLENSLQLSNTGQRVNSLISLIRDAVQVLPLYQMDSSCVVYDGRIYSRVQWDELSAFFYKYLCDKGINAIDVVKILPHISLIVRDKRIFISSNLGIR